MNVQKVNEANIERSNNSSPFDRLITPSSNMKPILGSLAELQNRRETGVSRSLNRVGNIEGLQKYGITPNLVDDDLDNQLSEAQGAFSKFKNAVAQAAVSEVGLGTIKGFSDLVDFVSGEVFRSDNDYSNPVSEYLAQLQEDFRNYAPIYNDPDKNIFNGGLIDSGWWASNLPSVMSSLTLMIPSTGITKGVSWIGKTLNTVSKGKIGAFARNSYKIATGASKAKTVEEAANLNRVTKWLNDTNNITAAQRMAETGFNAALMRTMENYQEANQVYDDMKTQALDKFNSMSDEEYNTFIQQNASKLEGVDVNDKEAVANKLAKDSADRTFAMDYVNTVFDIIQLNALRNPIKLLKNMRANASIKAADELSRSAIGKAASATEATAEKAGIAATTKNFGKGVGRFLKDSSTEVWAEASEGVEEAVNYIAQEEGMHYGNVALGEDINNNFSSRLSSYMRSPELYDAAFWGVLGGVVFQGLGSGLNRISVAAERAYQQKKKQADSKTGETVNKDSWQELFETSENKRRIADINKRTEDFNTLVSRLNQIEGDKDTPGVDPFRLDENKNPIQLETETEKTVAREQAISEYITGMTFRAMDNGNFDMLKAYLQDANIREALEKATGNQNDGGAFIDSLVNRMDHIADKYSQNIIALSNISRNVNIASSNVIPIEYLQIIARDNTANQIKLEDVNARISAYETSAENAKAVYGDKLDKSLNYKDTVQLVVLTQQLAQLRAKKAELEKDKSKQGIGRQIELDRINKNINIIEGMIKGSEDTSNSDALTKLLYATIQSDLINDEKAYATDLDALARGDVKAILGEDKAKQFKTNDEEIMKVLGADRTSGSYRTLATDINSVFEGAYGLNKIDKRIGDDYVVLASLNLDKAILNENIVMNETNLNKRVNELHNDILDARKKAIEQASSILRSLAKTYGRENMISHLETGDVITWNNQSDKKKFDDALEVLNLTSASNQQLYDDIQGMITMDELIELSQAAAVPDNAETGESSLASQKADTAAKSVKPNNLSGEQKKTDTEEKKSQTEKKDTKSEQPTTKKPIIPNGATTTTTNTTKIIPKDTTGFGFDNASQGFIKNKHGIWVPVVSHMRSGYILEDGSRILGGTLTSAEALLKRGNVVIQDGAGGHLEISADNVVGLIRTEDGKNGQPSKIFDITDEIQNQVNAIQPTIPSTGESKSVKPNVSRDDDGNFVPDAQREAIKTEIGSTIYKAVITAKNNKTDIVEAINSAAKELDNKYGKDEEFKKEINRMVKTWANVAKKKGLIQDLAEVITLASSVTEKGGKYNFPDEFLEATKKFVNEYLKAANAKEFNGQKVVSFESMLRFANEQIEDATTAEYIYKSLKSWFKSGPEANKYIVLDNMDSTSILQRAAMSNKELADSRLGGTNVFRVQIDQFLMRNASKAAIDKIQQGDSLNAKRLDNGDIILMAGDVEIGRLPQPEGDGTGGFKKVNNGWITDVKLANGSVVSNIRKIWEDILLNKSDINDKINNYIYQIIAANKVNGDTKTIKDNIEKDKDLTDYFAGLKSKGIIDDRANNVELVDGLVGIWNYIDLTSPIEDERKEDIQYSLDLWFNKLYDSYSTISNTNVIGLDKLSFTVAKITDGDVIQVAPNDNQGYEKCTLGNNNDAFANVENTELGLIRPGSVGVIQTSANGQYSQPNAGNGSMWAVLPNRSGIPGIVRGHMLKFMDTDKGVNNTPAGRIRQAISSEFERRIKNTINNEDLDGTKFNELMQFIDLVLSDRFSTPLLAPVTGGKFKIKQYRDDKGSRVVISFKKPDGNYTNFTINSEQMMYNAENLGYKPMDNVDEFIKDFKTIVLGAAMFNADYNYLDSDADTTSPLRGLASRDKDGNFVITIPNGTDNPLVETFPSFKHFVMQGGAARWNTKNENGSNFTPRSNNQLRNQVLNVSIENKTSSPVEEIVDNQITPETINNGQAIDALIEKHFGKNSPIVKRLKERGLIPSSITYTSEALMKGDHPSNIWTSISKKEIYVNDEFIKMMNDTPEMAIRKLIHEQLHLKLHSKGNRRKELLNRIQEIVNDFKTALDNDTTADPHLREYLFEHIGNNEEKLEEFLVESLTNRELASYLNSKQVESPTNKTKQSIFDKILELLADIFDWKVTEGSIYEKELRILQGFTAEEVGITQQPTDTPVEGKLQFKEEQPVVEEKKSRRRFGRDDRVGSSVAEIETIPMTEEMKSIMNKAIANGNYMQAPNGFPSNLPENLWLYVRTKEFKDWFGDWINDPANASKVVDENGEPKVVFRGINDANADKLFAYYTDSRTDARAYAEGLLTKGGAFFSNKKDVVGSVYEYLYSKYNLKNIDLDYISNILSDALLDGEIVPEEVYIVRGEMQDTPWFEGTLQTVSSHPYTTRFTEEEIEQAQHDYDILTNDEEAKELLTITYLIDSTTFRTESDLMRQYDDPDYFKDLEKLNRLLEKYNDIIEDGRSKYKPNIQEAFLNIKNPYMDESHSEDLLDNFKSYRNGHDGAFLLDGQHFLIKKGNQVKDVKDVSDIRGASVEERTTTPSVNQFVESLPLEESIGFSNLLLDGSVSMKCS